MIKYIENPYRIFFCKECLKQLKSNEYITLDWLNYNTVCLCWNVIKTDWHMNNLYIDNIIRDDIDSLECIDWKIDYNDIIWLL